MCPGISSVMKNSWSQLCRADAGFNTYMFNHYWVQLCYIDLRFCGLLKVYVCVCVCVCSVRLNERKQRGAEDNKKLAYLIDIKTIAIGKDVYEAQLFMLFKCSRKVKADCSPSFQSGYSSSSTPAFVRFCGCAENCCAFWVIYSKFS